MSLSLPSVPRVRRTREYQVFFEPLFRALLWLLNHIAWWMGLLGIAYLGSGVTIIQPDEVGVVYRWGAVRDGGGMNATLSPGVSFVWPKPIERVERVPVQKVFQISVDGLHFRSVGQMTFLQSSTLDPEKVGYILTGDGNVVHASFGVNYQFQDPILIITQLSDVETMLDQIVRSIAIQSIAARTVDQVLSDGRTDLMKEISRRVQSRLDELNLGIRIVSLEMSDLVPPYQVKDEFSTVQTASIEAKTQLQEAEEYRAQQIPKAETTYKKEVSTAEAEATKKLATARAEAAVFLRLAEEASENSTVVRRRLLQDKLTIIGKQVGVIRFVPPPLGTRYPNDFRIVLDGEP